MSRSPGEQAVSIGNRLRQGRQALRLRQREVARKLGISRQAVSRHERGDALPTILELDSYARLYNADHRWLISGERSAAFQDVPARVAALYAAADTEVREAVEVLLRASMRDRYGGDHE